MMTNAAVLLFCGDPRRDSWQKRLPGQFLVTIHRSLRQLIGTIDGTDLFTVTASSGRVQISGAINEHIAPAESLAEQIDISVRFAFSSGYERVVMLAGDVALLTRDVVVDALQALDRPSSSIVLGRSSDGGFYLAGFNRPPRFDWRGIVDRRARAADALVAQADQSGATLSLLPEVDDIDSYADALRLIALRRTFTASRTLVRQLISILLSAFAALPRALTLLLPQTTFDCLRGPPQRVVHA